MCDLGIIDTGVLIGFTIKQDQHHETTRDYILEADRETLILPPRAHREYQNAIEYIQPEFRAQIRDHRTTVVDQIEKPYLDDSTIRYVRDQLLDEDEHSRPHAFLFRYYTNKIEATGQLLRSNLIQDLSNMEFEVVEDQSEEYGEAIAHRSPRG